MGGWMTYRRIRERDGVNARKPDDDPDPYYRRTEDIPRGQYVRPDKLMLNGDLNRMERGYIAPEVDDGRNVGASLDNSPLHDAAEKTGVDIETVRKVLRYVFLEQR